MQYVHLTSDSKHYIWRFERGLELQLQRIREAVSSCQESAGRALLCLALSALAPQTHKTPPIGYLIVAYCWKATEVNSCWHMCCPRCRRGV